MRAIGRLDDQAAAQAFGDYLYIQGIENELRQEPDGTWGVWVYSEQQVESAKAQFARYRENPDLPEYRAASAEAQRMAAVAEQQDAAAQSRYFDSRRLWAGSRSGALGPLTVILIAASVGVAVLSRFGADKTYLRDLFITDYLSPFRYFADRHALPEIAGGQIWRLFTPALIHFGPLHLLFNMLWLRDLGGMMERVRGSRFLAGLVLVLAAASNLGELYWSGPSFGGMSGVIYGLLGFIWINGKRDPASGLYISPPTVRLAIIWFFLCLSGILGPIANGAHAVGLGTGMLLGYLCARLFPTVGKPPR